MTDYAPGTHYVNRHVNQYLTDFFLEWKNSGMIANIIAPSVNVVKQTDLYKIWGKEHFNVLDTRRADKAQSKTVAFGWSDDSYSLKLEALNFEVSAMERENSDDQLSPEFRGVERLGEMIDLAQENRVATLVELAASVTSANRNVVGTTTGFDYMWDDYDAYAANGEAGSPLFQIRKAKRQVYDATRVWPNALILTYEASEYLANHPAYLAKYKNFDTSLITDGGLLPVIQGLWVIEASAGYNTAKDGQTASISGMWDKTMCHVAYIDGLPMPNRSQLITGTAAPTSSMDRKTWIRTFRKSGGRVVRQWQLPWKRNVDVFEVEDNLTEKVTSTLLASRISGIITA